MTPDDMDLVLWLDFVRAIPGLEVPFCFVAVDELAPFNREMALLNLAVSIPAGLSASTMVPTKCSGPLLSAEAVAFCAGGNGFGGSNSQSSLFSVN